MTVHYTGEVWQSEELFAGLVPPPEDTAVVALLDGLRRAAGAKACVLSLQLAPTRKPVRYRSGEVPEGTAEPLVIEMERETTFRARWELFGVGKGPASSPRALEAFRPLVEGALLAVIEHWRSSHRLSIVAQILNVTDDAILLVDGDNELLYVNRTGERLLGERSACVGAGNPNGENGCVLRELVAREVAGLRNSESRLCQRTVRIVDEATWEMEIVALGGRESADLSLAVLSPVRLPEADEIQSRLSHFRVSRREAQVLALVLRGRKGAEIAVELGISEYTVKDHLKHAYAKLDITSGTQILARLAGEEYLSGA